MKIREPDTDLEDHIIQHDAGSGADEKKGERIVREDTTRKRGSGDSNVLHNT